MHLCEVNAGYDFNQRRQPLWKYQSACRRSENHAAATTAGVDTATTFDTNAKARAENPPVWQTSPLRLAERKAGARAARPRVPDFATRGRAVRAPFHEGQNIRFTRGLNLRGIRKS